MDLEDLRELTFWTLWDAKWQGIMRSSDILRPTAHKDRKWQPAGDTHVGQMLWEPIEAKENGGCETRMLWRLKPSKTNQSGAKTI